MITSTDRRAPQTRRLLAGTGLTLLVLAASTAHADAPVPDEALQFQVQAFTPPSPSTAEPTPPSSPTPSVPTPPAGAPGVEMSGYAAPTEAVDVQDVTEGSPMIPPGAENAPYAVNGGGYCYEGPHPADTRVVPGPSWDPTVGRHVRAYPPIDTRLFAYRDGCYYFTGDPRDFGYAGQTYAYYGAHPVLATYGGGWCFMMGGHAHLWSPWSPYFTVVGPWYYWQGAYDPFFWTYWPYYSFYYRSYYPHYYGGGRFYRGGGYRVAPAIHRVPASAWRGATPGHGPMRGPGFGAGAGAPITRGAAPMPMNRMGGAPSSPAATPSTGRTWHGQAAPPAAATMAPGARPAPSYGARPSFAPAPQPSFAPGARPSFSPGPRPSFSPGPRPSFSPGPRPSFSPSPGARPSFSPPAGGGFRGGGMGRGRH